MNISIVVPVLNEAPLIRDFLTDLRQRAPKAEIIIVDGDSSDRTSECAAGLCDQLLRTHPGRARQMNVGARAGHGEVFWFLHVDARIPDSAIIDIEEALREEQVGGGFFRIRLPRERFVYRLTDWFAHYAGLLLQIRCGDHGFFCRREIFEQFGGFPDVELMEDVDFFRRIRRAGKVAVVRHRLIVDPRRYEAIGPWRLTIAFGAIWLLYFCRVPRSTLQRIYRRFCCRSR
ncbi:MAG TPA: TIGR04283 family arsenosugar biosynthesis glycosyltransferase [Chthoniobacterales bacterium]